jgi:iron-sulfur cluster assembly protein
MITLTPAAVEQVKKSAAESQADGMALRLAARKNSDGSIDYGMGFDEPKEEDLLFKFDGVEVVIGGEYGPLLNGSTVDFVELEPGQFSFIFMNPNDANYTPPGDSSSDGGCGSGGCSSCN